MNLHAFWALDPKSNASANSAIPARVYFSLCVHGLVSFARMVHRTPQMRNRDSNLVGAILLSMAIAISLAAQSTDSMVAAPVSPAACHQHENLPARQPVSYRCCQNGHDSAILPISLNSQLNTLEIASSVGITAISRPLQQQNLCNLPTSSADPPNILPLRV